MGGNRGCLRFRCEAMRPLAVRFLLSNNLPVSISRGTATLASALVQRGVEATVVFPLVDWLDYKLFQISRGTLRRKLVGSARLLLEFLWQCCRRRPWCGYRYYGADRRIRSIRYLLTPPWSEGQAGEVTIVQHPYVLQHSMRRLDDLRANIVCMVRNNYELEMQNPVPEQAAWKRHCVATERMLAAPRVAVSERSRAAAERLGIRVDQVITNGIDLQRFQPAVRTPDKRRRIVTLSCATHPQKGQVVGVEACRMLRDACGEAISLRALGDALPAFTSLFDRCHGYLHGEDYVRALQETDIFVYPSLFDGFPAPPLEAMACGCAVVTTAVEGVTEYAVDGDNCLVCPPGDASALAAAVQRLLLDEPLRARLQRNGPATAQAYRIERIAEEWLAFLQELNGRPSGNAPSPSDKEPSWQDAAAPGFARGS